MLGIKYRMNINQLAAEVGATLYIPKECESMVNQEITDLVPLDTAKAGQVTFLTNPKLSNQIYKCRASAIIVGQKFEDIKIIQLIHSNPRLAMTIASQFFYQRYHSFSGQSNMAYISETARVDPSATIFPFAYIGQNVQVAENCVIYPNVYLGDGCSIGCHTIIYPNAVLMEKTSVGRHVIIHGGAVLGGDGFGFTPDKNGIQKIPQKGYVEIEDDCEIGPLATIDRATFHATRIRKGCKLDSQVHLGHNVDLGEHSMLCGQVGVAGSTKIGSRFIAAGQSAIGPGLTIGDNVVLGPRTGLTQSQETSGEYMGMPISTASDWRKQSIAIKKLPELLKKVAKLEKKLSTLLKQQDD